MDRPRVIFDCNVLVQAVLNPNGPGYRCLRPVEEGRVCLLLSAEVIAEARDVLNRPFVRHRIPEITPERVNAFLAALAYRAEVVREVPRVQVFSRDPKDQPYLDLAIAGAADFLVTRDDDLLALADNHSLEAKEFRQRHRNHLQIIRPVKFLEMLESTSAGQGGTA